MGFEMNCAYAKSQDMYLHMIYMFSLIVLFRWSFRFNLDKDFLLDLKID